MNSKKKFLGAASACVALLASVAFVSPAVALAAQPAPSSDHSPITWQSDGANYQAQQFSDGSVSVSFTRSNSSDDASLKGSITFWGADPNVAVAPSAVSWQEGTADEATTNVLTFDGGNGSGASPSATINIEHSDGSGTIGKTQLRARSLEG
ncbi:hypothetical protein OZX74_00840 [Bifidobacterium sp. ESL0798]|uniref:hypothetical protein n=1 Tax=Bifidobacterium sp. ESL0798 TaxID=2983235 RepID=UPI0023F88D9F|nr:hypothetical protein [Bifidobacterium sp. ESL0798]WEV74145.1 hypothetical protein OZX74_00840 [Bifidobacterium sp. ESL0798]